VSASRKPRIIALREVDRSAAIYRACRRVASSTVIVTFFTNTGYVILCSSSRDAKAGGHALAEPDGAASR